MADYMANTNRDMSGEKININEASAEELERISDIGPDYARRIVDAREQRGRFERMEDLDSIEGVGPETIKQLKASGRLD